MIFFTISIFFLKVFLLVESANQPNILFILADDLGYNDVGYRGNNQVKTPNIDALAYHGGVLERFYTLPMCTPSRTAILTGKYPIRTGLQGLPLMGGELGHLPTNIPTLPEHLKKLGYKTHLIGKWHLGYASRNFTPTARGFDSFYGYYNGNIGYFDHCVTFSDMKGFDFRENFRVGWETAGKYATDLFTHKAVRVIKEHNYDKPLFLMVSHMAVHTGKSISAYSALVEERNTTDMNKNFGYIKNINRRKLVDVLKSLDDSVGTLIKTLSEKKVLDNTIILFLSDNGGPSYGELHPNYSSNWPLKGIKMSHFEGGIRGTGIFYSKNMTYRGKVNSNLMHITDLLPTFYTIGGGHVKNLGQIDGMNQLDVLLHNKKSKRHEVLVNIEDVQGSAAIITNNGRYKLIQGIQYNGAFDGYGGVSGRLKSDGSYDVNSIINSDVNKVFGSKLKATDIENLRKSLSTKNCRKPSYDEKLCELCLFDLEEDPCENTNIVGSNSEIVEKMMSRLNHFRSQLVPQKRMEPDPKANPKYFDGAWSPWIDVNSH